MSALACSRQLRVFLSEVDNHEQLFNLDECEIAKSLADDRLVSQCRFSATVLAAEGDHG